MSGFKLMVVVRESVYGLRGAGVALTSQVVEYPDRASADAVFEQLSSHNKDGVSVIKLYPAARGPAS